MSANKPVRWECQHLGFLATHSKCFPQFIAFFIAASGFRKHCSCEHSCSHHGLQVRCQRKLLLCCEAHCGARQNKKRERDRECDKIYSRGSKKRYVSCEILVSESQHRLLTFGIWDKVTVVSTVVLTISLRFPDHSRHPPDHDFTSLVAFQGGCMSL